MKKTDLKDVLDLVKDKLKRDAEAGCGILYSDEPQVTTYYAIGEEDSTSTTKPSDDPAVTTFYAVGEED